MVWDLACALGELGVEVHLFAPPGSGTPPGGYLHRIRRMDQGVMWYYGDFEAVQMYPEVLKEMDVVHDWTHNKHVQGWCWWNLEGRAVSTPWGTVETRPGTRYNEVCWSRYQRRLHVMMGCGASTRVVYGGVDTDFYTPGATGDYVLFYARPHPTKRPELAIELAKSMGFNLVMNADTATWDHIVYLRDYQKQTAGCPNIRWVFNTTGEAKRALFRGARAVIHPSYGECFGLVIAESLACGTPVIVTRDGAYPEMITDGVHGYLCSTMPQFRTAIERIDGLDRRACRRLAEARYSRRRVAEDYLKIYEEVVDGVRF